MNPLICLILDCIHISLISAKNSIVYIFKKDKKKFLSKNRILKENLTLIVILNNHHTPIDSLLLPQTKFNTKITLSIIKLSKETSPKINK